MNKHILLAGPLFGASLGLVMAFTGWSSAASVTAAVTLWCGVWWVTEAIPIPVTSLIPLAIFPLVDILDANAVASAYGSPLILLLLGGFILSTAMERSGAHKQIALRLVKLFGGTSYRQIVFGFMAASAILSMWISNTATTLMLLPIALAVLSYAKSKAFSVALLLGICYSASIGGIGTPIGTPPNLIFMKVYEENTGNEISFLRWMFWALPVVLCLLPVVAWWLTRSLRNEAPEDLTAGAPHPVIRMPSIGPWSIEQKRVLVVFVVTALAWVTRKEPFGGWSTWLSLDSANDASVALMAVVAMFIIPSGDKAEPSRRLLDWETANKIPWGILFLFAGGLAIAKAFTSSGLAERLADVLIGITYFPLWLTVVCICLAVTFLTEITSNTATTSLLMPILAVGGAAAGIDPSYLMVPAAMSASCAFMLPVATAPNAIVFGSGGVPITLMLRRGLVLNILAVCIVSIVCLHLI